jgi:molecular chaperone GrpE
MSGAAAVVHDDPAALVVRCYGARQPDRTIRAAEDNDEAPALLEGTRQVRAQLERVLCGYGIERIDALGEHFDPNLHEAIHMLHSRDPALDRRVVDQLEPGYRFGDRLLRPAKVVVARTDNR